METQVDTAVVVGLADSVEAREAVYRFRLERGVRPRDTLHADALVLRGGLRDDLDPLAALTVAADARSGEVVGTVRTNFVRDGPVAPFAHVYGLAGLPGIPPSRISLTSGWTIAWEVRGADVPLALARAVYGLLTRERVRVDLLDCADDERPFFERLGYRWQRVVQYPSKGERHLMMLDVGDEGSLRACGSPLLGQPAGVAE